MDKPIQKVLTLDDLRIQRDAILQLAEKYGASNVRVFGSIARGSANPQSDVDLLVSFRKGTTLFDVAGLWVDMRDLLNCPVDIIDDRSVKPALRASILRDAVPL